MQKYSRTSFSKFFYNSVQVDTKFILILQYLSAISVHSTSWVLIPENSNSETPIDESTSYPDVSKSTTIQSVPSIPSSVHLRLQRGMHRSRLACWVGVKSPESSALNIANLQAGQMSEQMIWNKSERELNILCKLLNTRPQTLMPIILYFVRTLKALFLIGSIHAFTQNVSKLLYFLIDIWNH